jgi:hypothetical protein
MTPKPFQLNIFFDCQPAPGLANPKKSCTTDFAAIANYRAAGPIADLTAAVSCNSASGRVRNPLACAHPVTVRSLVSKKEFLNV